MVEFKLSCKERSLEHDKQSRDVESSRRLSYLKMQCRIRRHGNVAAECSKLAGGDTTGRAGSSLVVLCVKLVNNSELHVSTSDYTAVLTSVRTTKYSHVGTVDDSGVRIHRMGTNRTSRCCCFCCRPRTFVRAERIYVRGATVSQVRLKVLS
jgi:hypothetical protein